MCIRDSFEGVHEMFGIGFLGVFDHEIVHNQRGRDGESVVLPQTRCDGHWGVAVRFEQGGEAIVSDASGLREAVHAFSDFNVHIAVDDEVMEFVFVHNGVGYHPQGDSHVFIIGHWGFQIKIA